MLTNRLKEIRKQAGITQEKLAQFTDVRRETIIRLEKNLYNPSLELAFKIANVLKCDINVIFQYSNDTIQEEPEQIEGQLEIDNSKIEQTGISEKLIIKIDNMCYDDFFDFYCDTEDLLEKGELTEKEVNYIELIMNIYEEDHDIYRDPVEEADKNIKVAIKQAKQLYKIPE